MVVAGSEVSVMIISNGRMYIGDGILLWQDYKLLGWLPVFIAVVSRFFLAAERHCGEVVHDATRRDKTR